MRAKNKVQILFAGFWGRYKNFLEKALNTEYITYTLMKQRTFFDLCLDISNIVLCTAGRHGPHYDLGGGN